MTNLRMNLVCNRKFEENVLTTIVIIVLVQAWAREARTSYTVTVVRFASTGKTSPFCSPDWT